MRFILLKKNFLMLILSSTKLSLKSSAAVFIAPHNMTLLDRMDKITAVLVLVDPSSYQY